MVEGFLVRVSYTDPELLRFGELLTAIVNAVLHTAN